MPSSGTLQLTGHGFGHGHGMSQYGAQGAAKQGLTRRQILSFYYPGTTIAATTGRIRVRLSGATPRATSSSRTRADCASAGRLSATSYPVDRQRA